MGSGSCHGVVLQEERIEDRRFDRMKKKSRTRYVGVVLGWGMIFWCVTLGLLMVGWLTPFNWSTQVEDLLIRIIFGGVGLVVVIGISLFIVGLIVEEGVRMIRGSE